MIPSGCRGTNFEILGERITLDDQRVVAGGREILGEILENRFPVVVDLAGLAVHQVGGPQNLAAKRFADCLVSQTDTENRRFAGHFLDQGHGDAGFLRRAWSRRNHNAVGVHAMDLADCNPVVAMHLHLGAQARPDTEPSCR